MTTILHERNPETGVGPAASCAEAGPGVRSDSDRARRRMMHQDGMLPLLFGGSSKKAGRRTCAATGRVLAPVKNFTDEPTPDLFATTKKEA